ncbi:MAG TPA: sensor domain-containing diguanylate cyclase [Anaerolineaceae bacterium]|nr:sensor domain-containing diguanylate cyclase [Anaerolineaceae bacterium]
MNLFYKEILDHLYDGVYFVDRERRITYWNHGAERITGYLAEQVMGRRCADNILEHVDAAGRLLCTGMCPLAASMLDGQQKEAHVFLRHADGYRVPVLVRVSPIRDENGRIIGAVEIFSDNSELFHTQKRLEEMSQTVYRDPLTGAANRRGIDLILEAASKDVLLRAPSYGLILLDIDFFKQINDTHGHLAGDRILQLVATTLRKNIRPVDEVGRWGGDELLVVLRQVDAAELAVSAETLRSLVASSHILIEEEILQVTVSAGATLIRPDEDPQAALQRADELLYRSKQSGRNRVSVGL